jgi:uncharacterized membrane protein YqhA
MGAADDQQVDPVPWADRIERGLVRSLGLALIPVVVLLLAALGAFVYGSVVFVDSIRKIVHHAFPVGHQIGLFLLDVDLFLIGATLLISAVGFYELFIRQISQERAHRIPTWLQMRDLNDLKARVVAMVILVVSVSFVEVVVDGPKGRQVLDLGAGIALVIVALTIFLRFGNHGGAGLGGGAEGGPERPGSGGV